MWLYRFPFATELVNKKKLGRTPPAETILDEAAAFVRFSLAVAHSAQRILKRIKKRKMKII